MKKALGKLTYANVMSTLAVLLVVGGGTAFAAYELGKNSVKSRNIAPGAVRAPDIAKGAVKRQKIAKGAVDSARLSSGAVDTGNIAGGAVDTGKIAGGAVTTDKIAGGAVDEPKLSDSVKTKLNSVQRNDIVRIEADIAPNNPEHTLISRGPFRIYAKCWQTGASVYGYVFAATDQAGTIAIGANANLTGQSGFLNPDTAETPRRIAQAAIGAANLSSPLTGAVTMIHGSNSVVFGVAGAVKGANVPADGNNYGGGGARCIFTPYAIAVSG